MTVQQADLIGVALGFLLAVAVVVIVYASGLCRGKKGVL